MLAFAAVVLAGGAARRMGGVAKPSMSVGGVPMLTRVLDATAEAKPRIVVGALELVALLPTGVSLTTEDPPGGGPAAALSAGLELLAACPDPMLVAVLASDLPFLDLTTIAALREAARDAEGAVLTDDDGHIQWLAGVWHRDALRARMPAEPAGTSMRRLLDGLRMVTIPAASVGPPAWFDCDTEEDVRRAEEWTTHAG